MMSRHRVPGSLTAIRQFFSYFQTSVLLLLAVVGFSSAVCGQTFTVIHNFTGGADGGSPYAGVTIDREGNLYGTTLVGGPGMCGGVHGNGCGVVFKLQHHGSDWTLTTLFSFDGTDGFFPQSRVVFGPNGTLYGTTTDGPTSGTVFNLTPRPNICGSAQCPWDHSIIYAFTGGSDGAYPAGDLTFDQAGNIYGTTTSGGLFDSYGVAYEISGGTETVLHSFTDMEGTNPQSGVIFDRAGNLYGTLPYTIGSGCGSVFKLTPSGSGWAESTLYVFGNPGDGCNPLGGLTFNQTGNLYGTTAGGSPNDQGFGPLDGIVFQLLPFYSITYSLGESLSQLGEGPTATLTVDSAGNLYGTTHGDGTFSAGSVFEVSASGTGTDLYDFTGGVDGKFPLSNVVLDANGNLYGTTSQGGLYGFGVVWEITP
jgi:uncharacterized repeat protein (TIGR03803 family)